MNSLNNQWPVNFVDRIQKQFQNDGETFLQALDNKSFTSVRTNSSKHSFEINLEKVPWCKNAFFLNERPSFVFDPLWHAGTYYVQEASSMFLEQVINQIEIDQPKLVLDLCAAPGGKSTHLNSLIDKDDLLVANEVIQTRVPILAENLTKWGQNNFVVSNSDASVFGNLNGLFDVILVDAPCSGEGLFRRDPKAAGEWSVENTMLCATRQRRILAECWPALKSGGYLIYSTCTFNPEENERNLNWLKSENEFESIKIPLIKGWQVDEIEFDGIFGYRFLPQKTQGEGFFISLLKKTGEENSVRFPKKFKQRLSKPSVTVPKWQNNENKLIYFQHNDQLKSIPARWEKEILFLLEKVRIAKVGTDIGQIKNKTILPSHDLAMNVHFQHNEFLSVELNQEQAISYLKKEISFPGSHEKGWFVPTFKEVPLGFAKSLGSRNNNYYPKEWRIRTTVRYDKSIWYL